MGIGGLVVYGRSYPGVGYGQAEVQKRKRRLADLKGVFERRMVSGTKFYKVLEILSCVRGCPKYVINITFVELKLLELAS